MKIPKMYINVACNNTMLPFFITGAPNVDTSDYKKWLFSGCSRQTLSCTGPITNKQLSFLREQTSGEILYNNRIIKFGESRITDIIKRENIPFTATNILPIFHRPYDMYIVFYLLIIDGIGHYYDI